MKPWQDRIKALPKTDKIVYVKLSAEEREEVNAFFKATEKMTMEEIMAHTKKTQKDKRHPFVKYREKYQ